MSLQITGVLKTVLPLEKGTTKAGAEWQKQSFIVANNDGYENREQIFCFEVFGEEKVQNFNKFNKQGDNVTVEFNISTNEWNGKYFTSLQSWKISKDTNGIDDTKVPNASEFELAENITSNDNDNLPF
ncbi:Protein of unknown function DUF3127 [uncultured Caudovirales phage]|uniref:DUF3127 domain-containing protein n=1 Tax=uncultured Caudovirales phage TaxID=2100421 RepID=A0A6J5R0X2_9CAUD|nr:Protein of unknown function DUF3127 [uncultured Caudovirales phage]CAB4179236.1 Protein of unknown function DUF3127 [uncultured Caudovirales phage]CAB4188276.1 Protein of unknown function DUF3127 [uncultured Caudovirales phage]CAB4220552.1 Protein of unknown function DUF3127 [uncultured Caudovirales phage]